MGIRMGFGWMLDMEDERNQIDVLWGEWSGGGGVEWKESRQLQSQTIAG